MDSQILLIIMGDHYPFKTQDAATNPCSCLELMHLNDIDEMKKTPTFNKSDEKHKSEFSQLHRKIRVKQILHAAPKVKYSTLAKAYFLKNLKNKLLVRLQNILQEKKAQRQELVLFLLYEHIPTSLQNYLFQKNSRPNSQTAITLQSKLAKIHQDTMELIQYLSNIGVKIALSIDRMGYDNTKGHIKFFMGMDFQWDQSGDEDTLREYYQKEFNRYVIELSTCKKQSEDRRNKKTSIFYEDNNQLTPSFSTKQKHIFDNKLTKHKAQAKSAEKKPENIPCEIRQGYSKNRDHDVSSVKNRRPINKQSKLSKVRKFSSRTNLNQCFIGDGKNNGTGEYQRKKNDELSQRSVKKTKIANKMQEIMKIYEEMKQGSHLKKQQHHQIVSEPALPQLEHIYSHQNLFIHPEKPEKQKTKEIRKYSDYTDVSKFASAKVLNNQKQPIRRSSQYQKAYSNYKAHNFVSQTKNNANSSQNNKSNQSLKKNLPPTSHNSNYHDPSIATPKNRPSTKQLNDQKNLSQFCKKLWNKDRNRKKNDLKYKEYRNLSTPKGALSNGNVGYVKDFLEVLEDNSSSSLLIQSGSDHQLSKSHEKDISYIVRKSNILTQNHRNSSANRYLNTNQKNSKIFEENGDKPTLNGDIANENLIQLKKIPSEVSIHLSEEETETHQNNIHSDIKSEIQDKARCAISNSRKVIEQFRKCFA